VGDSPSLEVGSDPTSVSFGWISGAALLPSQTFVVGDNMGKELHYFGPDGTYIRSAGGPGQGPGEFASISQLVAWADTVIVTDQLNQRITLMSEEGEYVRSVTPDPLASSELRAFGVANDRLIVFAGARSGRQEGLSRDTMILAAVDVNSGAAPAITTVLGEEYVVTTSPTSLRMRRAPFSRTTHVATDGDRIALGFSDADSIVVRGADERLLFTIRRESLRRSIGREEIHRYYTATRDSGSDVDAYLQRAGNPDAAPDHMPTLAAIIFDAVGNLWVQRYAPPWEDQAAVWDVYDREGKALGVVESGIIGEVLHIDDNRIIAAVSDSLDVQSLAFFPLIRGELPNR
jgi:hypothetical protein